MFNDNCSRPTNEETNIEADGNTFEFSYMDPTEKAVGFFQWLLQSGWFRALSFLSQTLTMQVWITWTCLFMGTVEEGEYKRGMA